MQISRPSRILAAVLALVSILFMQIALAAYACPVPTVDRELSTSNATRAFSKAMPDCDGMDLVQPSLCHANVHTQHQSLDRHDVPPVHPFVAAAISNVIFHFAIPDRFNTVDVDTTRLGGAPPPPISIRNCCFRI